MVVLEAESSMSASVVRDMLLMLVVLVRLMLLLGSLDLDNWDHASPPILSKRCKWNSIQWRPWSDCSSRSSLIWVCTVCPILLDQNLRIKVTLNLLLAMIKLILIASMKYKADHFSVKINCAWFKINPRLKHLLWVMRPNCLFPG